LRHASPLFAQSEDPNWRRIATKREYARGLRFSGDNIYLGLLRCGRRFDGTQPGQEIALVMRRLHHDLARQTITHKILQRMIEGVAKQHLSARERKVRVGSSANHFQETINRVKSFWPAFSLNAEDRKHLSTEIESIAADISDLDSFFSYREARGWIRLCHGDRKLDHAYNVGDSVVFIDPCVASPDMYLIDLMSDITALIISCEEHFGETVASDALRVYRRIMPQDAWDERLWEFYCRYRRLLLKLFRSPPEEKWL